MSKHRPWSAAVALWALGLSGCAGTETGNPDDTIRMRLVGHTTDPASVSVDGSPATAVVSETRVGLSQVALLPCLGGREQTVFEGSAPTSLLGQPAPGAIELPAGAFCGMVLQLAPTGLPATEPDGTAQLGSIYVAGSRDDGMPFSIRSEVTHVIQPASEQQVDELSPGTDWLVALDLAVWLAEVPLSSLDGQGGSIVIDPEQAPDVLYWFETQVAPGATLREDLDGDGVLDPNE